LGTLSPACVGDIYRNLEISKGRALWPDASDSAIRGFHRCEYCRRLWKKRNNEFQRFSQIAAGSASELDYELLPAKDLGYLTNSDCSIIADELSQLRKMLRFSAAKS
jgi:hypothetical protein